MQLARQRKEQLRRKKVRHQARSLLKRCQKQIHSIKDPAVQQIAAPRLQSIQDSLAHASDQIKQAPDMALQTIRDQQENLNKVIARAEAEAERLRIQQFRDQANSLLTSSEKIIKGVIDPSVQQLAAEDLRDIQSQMQQASRQIQSEPEKAKQQIAKLQEQLRQRLSEAQRQAEELSAQKAEAKAKLESVSQSLEAQKESADQDAQETLAKAEEMVNQASSLYSQDHLEDMSALCEKATGLIEQASQEALAESERREVVGGLLTTLNNMGFVVDPPQLEDQGAGSVVRLVGKMPSGRTAVFHVNLNGKLAFDFDGYEGRTCAKDMEAIETALEEQFSIKLGPAQVTWKNPDKIAKGANRLPTGTRNQTHY